MALWQKKIPCFPALMAGTALALVAGADARAEFPGERWSVSYVQVEGTDPGTSSAVSLGLTRANETYFYGNRTTRMDARLRGNVFDLRIVDPATGQVIAKQTGLPYDPGNVAESVSNSALAWMDRLGCVDDCNLAEAGVAPAPVTEVAAAPAPEPQPEPVATPEPVAAPDPQPVSDPAPQPEVEQAAEQPAPADSAPETEPQEALQLALPEPTSTQGAPTSAEIAAILNAPSLVPQSDQAVQSPSPSLALAEAPRVEAADLSQPGVSAAAPTPGAPDSAVEGFDADLFLSEAEKAEASRLSAPTVGDTPASASFETAASADVRQPQTPAAPVARAPAIESETLVIAAAPAASAAAPSAPSIAEPTPSAPAISQPAQPSLETEIKAPAVETSNESALQEVAPGVSLPQPGSRNAASLQSAAATSAPSADSANESAPETRETLALSSPADLEAPALSSPATPAPRITTSEETSVAAAAPAVQAPAPEITAAPAPSAPAPQDVASTAEQAAEAPVAPAVEAPVIGAPAADIAVATAAAAAAPAVDARSSDPATAPAPAATAPAVSPEPADDLNGEQLALANPAAPVSPRTNAVQPVVPQQEVEAVTPQIVQPQTQTEGTQSEQPSPQIETEVAAVDPTAIGPTLANARWVGFTPAVFTGSDTRTGVWISGPFDRKERTGWITDTATGATARVRFVWREGGSGGRTALLSREAARALGLGQGDVANVAVYLPR